MVYRTAVKVGVIFADAKNKAKAKEFVQFLLQEENLTPYVEGALGRWFPVTKDGAGKPVLAGRSATASRCYDQYKAGTVTFEFTKNYKFTILNNENVWAKAMNRVVSEKVPVDKAVDEMIARIKQVAGLASTGGRPPSGSGRLIRRCERMTSVTVTHAPRSGPEDRRMVCAWQAWGLILIAPYVLSSCSSCSTRWVTASGSRAPATLRRTARRSDLRAVDRQHARIPDRRHQSEDDGGAAAVGIFHADRRGSVAVGALHPALGGAVDPDHPVVPLHAQSRMGRSSTSSFSASPARTARTGSTLRRWRSWRCSSISGSRCRSGPDPDRGPARDPGRLYEAASVDGATRLQKFRYVTWPSMQTLYLTCTILSMIWTLGDFNSVYLLTGGGPADLTHVLATLGIRYLRLDQVDLSMAAIVARCRWCSRSSTS